MAHPPVTLDLIARAAGVSKSTVSRALRGYHWTSNKTTLRVQQIARELGYEPDARLAELTTHLRKRKEMHDRPSLALLLAFDKPVAVDPAFKGGQNVIRGLMARSQEMGYSLDIFYLNEAGMTPERLSKIWWNRGISGVIVYPLERPGSLAGFQWDLFSWVTTGYSVRQPEIHRVVIDYHQVTWLGVSKAIEQGSERLGLFLLPSLDERTLFHYRSVYLGCRDRIGSKKIAPILAASLDDDARLEAWIDRFKLDTVLVSGTLTALAVDRFLVKYHASRGRRPKIVDLSCDLSGSPAGGVYQDSVEVAREAVDYLIQLIHKSEKGIPAVPRTIMIPGTWNDRIESGIKNEPGLAGAAQSGL